MVVLGEDRASPVDGGPGNVAELWNGHALLVNAVRDGLGDNIGVKGEEGELRGGHSLLGDDASIQDTVL